MRPWGAHIAAVVTVLAMSGCGSSHHSPRPLNAREQIETVCGDLKARLAAIYRQTTEEGREPLSEPPAGRDFQRSARESAAALEEVAHEVARAMPGLSGGPGTILLRALHTVATDFRALADEAQRRSSRPEPITPRQERELEESDRVRFSPIQERLLERYNALEAGIVRNCLAVATEKTVATPT